MIARGLRAADPSVRLDLMPVSDGGDGLIEVLLERLGGRLASVRVVDALGRPCRASYALLKDGRTAVVEMARASGIARLKGRRDPLAATSYGTGQLIADALRRGRRHIVVGMGGSASSDGGAGMAQALGARLLDEDGRELPRGAAALLRLERVDAGPLKKLLKGARVTAVSDVRNPLLGPRGSARVYGPQKGASPAQVRLLERAMRRWAGALGRGVARRPGAGAAGGLGSGLAALLRARLAPGSDWVLAALKAGPRIARADLVVTGEGRLDRQSFYGKAPIELARRARKAGVPTVLLCGSVEGGLSAPLRRLGARASALSRPGDPRALAQAPRRLKAAAQALLACLVLALPARSADFSEVDRLYLHRDEPGNLERSNALLEGSADARALWRLCRGRVRAGERLKAKREKLAAFESARDLCERAAALAPEEAQAHFWAGLAMGRYGQARGILRSLFLVGPIKKRMRRVLELDPRHDGAHHVLGEMLRQIPAFAGGSKRQAVSELEKAVELGPGHTEHYPALGRAYLDLGDKEAARRALERVFAVKEPADPAEHPSDLEEARRMLADLGTR